MNCQQCAIESRSQEAVCLCPACSAGLCLEHKRAHERWIGPGGTRYGCEHSSLLRAVDSPGVAGRLRAA
jgi:hypothetical protein